MSVREDILSAIRQRHGKAQPRPELLDSWTRYDDPAGHFVTMLELVGGQSRHVADAAAAHSALTDLPAYQAAKQRCSLVPGIGETDIDPRDVEDPHQLQRLDFAVLPGQFAVAENAAVWVMHHE